MTVITRVFSRRRLPRNVDSAWSGLPMLGGIERSRLKSVPNQKNTVTGEAYTDDRLNSVQIQTLHTMQQAGPLLENHR